MNLINLIQASLKRRLSPFLSSQTSTNIWLFSHSPFLQDLASCVFVHACGVLACSFFSLPDCLLHSLQACLAKHPE